MQDAGKFYFSNVQILWRLTAPDIVLKCYLWLIAPTFVRESLSEVKG
jgi:hypothetical protein